MASMSMRWSFLPGLAVVGAALAATEYAFVYAAGSVGILAALVSALTLYAGISGIRMSPSMIEVLEDCSLLFIYILLMASLPWFYLNQSLLIPGVYTVVLGLSFWRIRAKELTLKSIGLVRQNFARDSLVGLLIGIPTGLIEFFILRPAGTPVFSILYLLQTAVYMFAFVGLGEELLFRALILRSAVKAVGALRGIIWAALIFSIMHTVWHSVPELFFTFGAGLMLGIFYYRTNSLTGPIFIHATNNIILLAILPYVLR